MDRLDVGKKIDFTNCTKNVWLVKVPKFMSDTWESCEDNESVGILTINKTKVLSNSNNLPINKGPEIMFALSPKLSKILYKDEASSSLAKLNLETNGGLNPLVSNRETSVNHRVLLNPVQNNTMYVYSQNLEPSKESNTLPFTIEGKVSQRTEIQPLSSSQQYMKLKKEQFTLKNQPVHFVQKLERHVQNYKPVSDHFKFTKHDLVGTSSSGIKSNLNADAKKVRLDKDRVMELLFAAFEKHQYYSIKDLVKISDQPVTYLKEVLKEICNYNLKNPYRNMWELKPEYRHYSTSNCKS